MPADYCGGGVITMPFVWHAQLVVATWSGTDDDVQRPASLLLQ